MMITTSPSPAPRALTRPPRLAARAALALLLCGAGLWSDAGCVTKKKYTALEQQLGETSAALAKEQSKSQDLEQALAQEKAHAQELDAQIADLTSELQGAQNQLAELETQLSETLKDKSKLRESVEEMRRALALAKLQRRRADARIAQYKSLLGRFQSMIDAGKLQVKIQGGRMVLVLRSDILFASGSTKISDEGVAAINELTEILKTMQDRKFQVEGHTDNQPIKTQRFPSNWELASGRAIAVSNVMIGAGMPADNISAASYGETQPVASNDTPEGRAQNRRIEIVLVPDLSDLPGFDELEKMGKSA